jgi:hypothetical protein
MSLKIPKNLSFLIFVLTNLLTVDNFPSVYHRNLKNEKVIVGRYRRYYLYY